MPSGRRRAGGAAAADRDFLRWLGSSGAVLDGVAIAPFADTTGRGVVAARDLQAGETVVSVPEALVLTAESGAAAEALASFGLGPEELDSRRLEREALVLSVLAELTLGSKSKWAPYMAAMPAADSLHCPVLWSKGELSALEGTVLLERMTTPDDDSEELPNMTDEHWEHVVVPFLKANQHLGLGTGEAGRREYNRAVALVAGYSFSLGEDQVQAMVPFWDMLNHVSPRKKSVRLNYDPDLKVMQMITIRDISKGSQVFNSYGPIGNIELLRRYGFTEQSNPHDSAVVRFSHGHLLGKILPHVPEAQLPYVQAAHKLLIEAEILMDEGLEVEIPRSGSPPPLLLEVLRVLTLDAEDVAQLIYNLEPKGPRRRFLPVRALSRTFKVSPGQAEMVGQVLAELAQDALTALAGTPSAEQHESPKDVAGRGQNSGAIRRAFAQDVVRSEQSCLRAMLASVEHIGAVQLLEQLQSCKAWRLLARKRRRGLPDYAFSPYHKHSHVLLTRRRAKPQGDSKDDDKDDGKESHCCASGCQTCH